MSRFHLSLAIFALLSIGGCREAVAPDEGGDPALSNAPALPLPTGAVLAFQRSQGGTSDIYTIAASGQYLTQLTFGTPADSHPAWAPNGQKLVWTQASGGVSQIYVMNPDGSGKTNLSNSTTRDRLPLWSPDGTRILFERRVNLGWLSNWEIYLMNANGTGQTNLSKHVATDQTARWSPSGAQVIFVSTRDGNREVYRVNADGTSPVNLTKNVHDDDHPSWSPNGQKIAFERFDPPGCCFVTVYTMNADGSAQALLNGQLEDPRYPRWSPSGSKLQVQEQGDIQITILDADGSDPLEVDESVNGLGDVAWSPGGGRVAYWSWEPYHNGNADVQGLRTVRVNGGGKHMVTNHLAGTGIRDGWVARLETVITSAATDSSGRRPSSGIPTSRAGRAGSSARRAVRWSPASLRRPAARR